MFCDKCGSKNREGASFCYNCGNELIIPDSGNQAVVSSSAASASVLKPQLFSNNEVQIVANPQEKTYVTEKQQSVSEKTIVEKGKLGFGMFLLYSFLWLSLILAVKFIFILIIAALGDGTFTPNAYTHIVNIVCLTWGVCKVNSLFSEYKGSSSKE